jgi:murein DD-endopeptidase MepM/ murein hydrolase activator NlpD
MNILQIIGLLITTVAAQQGQAVRLSLPDQPGMEFAQIQWQGKSIPYTKIGKEWITVIGVDLDVKASDYPAEIEVTRNGNVEKSDLTVHVKEVKFPVEHLQVEEQYVELSPENTERALREARELEDIHNSISPEALWREPFIVPIPGGVGSSFGKRRVFNGESRNPHAGADLKATTGTPIRSANRGRVVLAKNLFFTGNTVIVDHGLGVYTLYAHLSRMNVKEGEIVERAKIIGLAGATGRVTGPHLHWGRESPEHARGSFSLINLGK